MTSASQFTPQKASPIRLGEIIWLLLFVGLIGAGIGFPTSPVPAEIPLVVLGLFLAVGVLLFYYPAYRTAFLGFVFVLFAIFDFAGYLPVLTSPIKIYLADGVILLMTILSLRALFAKTFIRQLASPVTGLLLLNFLYGFLALAIGFAAGHQFNDVLGDFRRFFFYPLAALIPLSYLSRPGDIRKLIILFGIALMVTSSIAIMRVATGQTWDPDQFAELGDFRAIGYFTGIIVLRGIGVFYGLTLISRGYQKWAFLLVTGLLIGVTLVSGYRLLWVLAIAMLLFVSYAAFRGQRRILRLVSTGVLILLLFIGVILMVRFLFPDWYLLLIDKFQTRVLEFSFENNLRYYAWLAAWTKFLGSPIIGVGIGDQFEFRALSSIGTFYLSRATTHNILLSLLYQTGIIGGGLFLAIHFRVFWYVWRRLARFDLHIGAPLVGMLGGYLAALTMGMFQPLFESPGAVVGFYLWVGLMLKIVGIYAGGEPPLLGPENRPHSQPPTG